MAGVESMYYQVRVPENQQTYLKFLWWENHDVECHPQEFVIYAHFFGGMFYIEQQWTMKLSLAAASTLHNSFYVNDLLKSVGYINITKKLVKDVISMRKSGGFNLAKFVSNSMELLQSIPK